MASSRLERIGTIYTRVRGLLRSGAMKQSDKPLWYDVYEAFPPKLEPTYSRKAPDVPVKDLIYPEDFVRAKYYKVFGTSETISLLDNKPSESQKFVDKYLQMKTSFTDEEELFKAVADALKEEKSLAETSPASETDSKEKAESLASMYDSAMKQKQKQNKINVQDLFSEK